MGITADFVKGLSHDFGFSVIRFDTIVSKNSKLELKFILRLYV